MKLHIELSAEQIAALDQHQANAKLEHGYSTEEYAALLFQQHLDTILAGVKRQELSDLTGKLASASAEDVAAVKAVLAKGK